MASGEVCAFCGHGQDVQSVCGKLHCQVLPDTGNTVAAHKKCMQYSAKLVQHKFDHFGGFEIAEVQEEIERGKRLKCFWCKFKKKRKTGATSGCELQGCPKSFHFYCASTHPASVTCRRKSLGEDHEDLYWVFCSQKHKDKYLQTNKGKQEESWNETDEDEESYERENVGNSAVKETPQNTAGRKGNKNPESQGKNSKASTSKMHEPGQKNTSANESASNSNGSDSEDSIPLINLYTVSEGASSDTDHSSGSFGSPHNVLSSYSKKSENLEEAFSEFSKIDQTSPVVTPEGVDVRKNPRKRLAPDCSESTQYKPNSGEKSTQQRKIKSISKSEEESTQQRKIKSISKSEEERTQQRKIKSISKSEEESTQQRKIKSISKSEEERTQQRKIKSISKSEEERAQQRKIKSISKSEEERAQQRKIKSISKSEEERAQQRKIKSISKSEEERAQQRKIKPISTQQNGSASSVKQTDHSSVPSGSREKATSFLKTTKSRKRHFSEDRRNKGETSGCANSHAATISAPYAHAVKSKDNLDDNPKKKIPKVDHRQTENRNHNVLPDLSLENLYEDLPECGDPVETAGEQHEPEGSPHLSSGFDSHATNSANISNQCHLASDSNSHGNKSHKVSGPNKASDSGSRGTNSVKVSGPVQVSDSGSRGTNSVSGPVQISDSGSRGTNSVSGPVQVSDSGSHGTNSVKVSGPDQVSDSGSRGTNSVSGPDQVSDSGSRGTNSVSSPDQVSDSGSHGTNSVKVGGPDQVSDSGSRGTNSVKVSGPDQVSDSGSRGSNSVSSPDQVSDSGSRGTNSVSGPDQVSDSGSHGTNSVKVSDLEQALVSGSRGITCGRQAASCAPWRLEEGCDIRAPDSIDYKDNSECLLLIPEDYNAFEGIAEEEQRKLALSFGLNRNHVHTWSVLHPPHLLPPECILFYFLDITRAIKLKNWKELEKLLLSTSTILKRLNSTYMKMKVDRCVEAAHREEIAKCLDKACKNNEYTMGKHTCSSGVHYIYFFINSICDGEQNVRCALHHSRLCAVDGQSVSLAYAGSMSSSLRRQYMDLECQILLKWFQQNLPKEWCRVVCVPEEKLFISDPGENSAGFDQLRSHFDAPCDSSAGDVPMVVFIWRVKTNLIHFANYLQACLSHYSSTSHSLHTACVFPVDNLQGIEVPRMKLESPGFTVKFFTAFQPWWKPVTMLLAEVKRNGAGPL